MIRTQSDPIISLSAHGEEINRIIGMELGADDYVPKPYLAGDLIARKCGAIPAATPSPAKIDQQEGS